LRLCADFEKSRHFPGTTISAFPYKRSPLISAREEDAVREGKELKSAPVEAVLLTAKELECSDLVAAIRQQQKQSRCKWKDFAFFTASIPSR